MNILCLFTLMSSLLNLRIPKYFAIIFVNFNLVLSYLNFNLPVAWPLNLKTYVNKYAIVSHCVTQNKDFFLFQFLTCSNPFGFLAACNHMMVQPTKFHPICLMRLVLIQIEAARLYNEN